MQLGMIGLGRMGGRMVQRLLRGGHACVAFDSQPASVTSLVHHGATGSHSLDEFIKMLDTLRVVWLMLPAAAVDTMLHELSPHLQPGDVVVDGGNSHYVDDIRRAKALEARGVHYLDAGVSGGVWGVERGYCLMIGGGGATVAQLDPIFKTLAPGFGAATRTLGRDPMNSTAEEGYLHCGPVGAGHFVMVHNAIEYALMAAYGGFQHRPPRARPVEWPTRASVWWPPVRVQRTTRTCRPAKRPDSQSPCLSPQSNALLWFEASIRPCPTDTRTS